MKEQTIRLCAYRAACNHDADKIKEAIDALQAFHFHIATLASEVSTEPARQVLTHLELLAESTNRQFAVPLRRAMADLGVVE